MDAEILLETGAATLFAVLGGAIAVAAAGDKPAVHQRRLSALVSLAAGALLAVTLVSLLPEAREHLSLFVLLFAALSGYALYSLVGRYLFPVCPACAGSNHSISHKSVTNFRNIATVLGVVVAAHAAVDGIAIASSPHSAAQSLPLLFALSLHKLPEGLALTALLMGSGFRRSPAFLLTVGIEMATLLGGAVGILLRDVASPVLLSGIMAHIGGGFLYLAFQALKGETGVHSSISTAAYPRRVGYGVVGFAAVSLVLWFVHLLPVTR